MNGLKKTKYICQIAYCSTVLILWYKNTIIVKQYYDTIVILFIRDNTSAPFEWLWIRLSFKAEKIPTTYNIKIILNYYNIRGGFS